MTYANVVPVDTAYLTTGSNVTQNSNGQIQVTGGTQLSFPFNPNSLVFQYNLNRHTFDTYGGRVTQILSVSISNMTIQGDAGSRVNLMAFFTGYKSFQESQIQSSQPLILVLPKSNLSFYVWLRGLDIGWDPTTVTYPYNLSLEVMDSSYRNTDGSIIGYSNLSTFVSNSEIQNLFNGAGANQIGYGNDGTTTLSAYYAGMAGYNRYTSTGIKYNTQTLQNTTTNLGPNPAAAN